MSSPFFGRVGFRICLVMGLYFCLGKGSCVGRTKRTSDGWRETRCILDPEALFQVKVARHVKFSVKKGGFLACLFASLPLCVFCPSSLCHHRPVLSIGHPSRLGLSSACRNLIRDNQDPTCRCVGPSWLGLVGPSLEPRAVWGPNGPHGNGE